MSNHGYDAFVSAVRSECGKAHDAVAAELRKQDLRVAVQSDLRHGPTGVSLLRTLHDTISDCADVHCLVGQRSGECPPPDTAAPFRDFLPETFAEASYTQWEYFFARRYVPDRTWLYLAAETYQPDEPAPTGPEHPELQLRFLDYLRRHGDGHLRFATIGDVRAEVLARRGQRSSAEAHGAGHQAAHEPLRRAVAANAIGSLIAGLLLLLLTSLAAQLGGGLDLLLLAPALLLSTLGAAAFFVLYHRYEAILSCRDADARAAYAALRHSLTEGGLAARVYAYQLRRALDAVDCFFGDADMADRTLLPHAFGLRTPAPLWTAAAFDRCLLLALIYPMATIVIFWAISGHVGPAEHALNLMPALPSWRRAIAVGAAALAHLIHRM
ncbi:MAG TPA: hypothetical protein VND19_11725 [Acetobacteraceae bacterium]|nr:hypothetical protein [Acetobacteraceae bacterium]